MLKWCWVDDKQCFMLLGKFVTSEIPKLNINTSKKSSLLFTALNILSVPHCRQLNFIKCNPTNLPRSSKIKITQVWPRPAHVNFARLRRYNFELENSYFVENDDIVSWGHFFCQNIGLVQDFLLLSLTHLHQNKIVRV